MEQAHKIDLLREMQNAVAVLQAQIVEISSSEDEEALKLIPAKGRTAQMFTQMGDILRGMILPCPACAAREAADGVIRSCEVCGDKGFLKLRAVEGSFSALRPDEIAESA